MSDTQRRESAVQGLPRGRREGPARATSANSLRSDTLRSPVLAPPASWGGDSGSVLPLFLVLVVLAGLAGIAFLSGGPAGGAEAPDPYQPSPLRHQTPAQAQGKSAGCLACHGGVEKMHASGAVKLGCTDCHGGDASAAPPVGSTAGESGYEAAKSAAHIAPLYPEHWPTSANPETSYTALLKESAAFVRFVNPGDLRVAAEVCGGCHPREVDAVRKSPMTTTAIFWAAAAYANGILGQKSALLGESYGRDGTPYGILPVDPPTDEEKARGAVSALLPIPRWEVIQPGEYFRVFEDGGLFQPSAFPEIGNPNPFEDPGRPDARVSNRGRGTGLRVSPGVINLHKTRLNNPHLSMLGTNDHPGDYRSSGCTACHVVYANDRDPAHSAGYAEFGHRGRSQTGDPTIPKDESGHPLTHRFTRAVPTSQCMVCHMHQPNAFENTYLGYTMWDYETDGEFLWPEAQRYPTAEERRAVLDHNPEGAAPRGLWSDREFLAQVSELNPQLKHTQFADYHGHGWVFRAVYKRDRRGNLLDGAGTVVPFDDPARFARAVHLQDIHLEKGMHCSDCHFSQDVHGDGLLHGEYGNAIEIECQDCHGTVAAHATLKTSGPAAPPGGSDLTLGTTPFGKRRFLWRGEALFQRSMVDPQMEWQVSQVKDAVTEGHPEYNPRCARAKTIQNAAGGLAHQDAQMTCYSCHSSWMTSCFGCHLPQQANEKSEMKLFEGETLRNYATYNPQVIRTDVYMLGKNSPIKGGKIAPVRSSSALILSSINLNRKRIYMQQAPISTPGYSSQAFNPHVPHTVRKTETKACTDCHLSADGDNNAWMAQLLTLGTNFVNFVGRYAWVGQEHGFEAVAVTEWEEPQAVVGSFLHRLAYPDFHAEHEARGRRLEEAHHHHSGGPVTSIQLRGEYLFTAEGKGGMRVYDVANIDNGDFSERIVTAPVSPLGQDTHIATRDAAAIALPTNMPIAPWREIPEGSQEQPWHPIYHYAFIADRQEGVILVNVDTLTDANPRNNFLERALTWNPEGRLNGARAITLAGNHAYIGCDAGLTVVDFSAPLAPKILAVLPELQAVAAIAVQFRYAFVIDREGLAVVEVTFPERPTVKARLPIAEAHNVYVARTYAYVAAGSEGVVIVDVERPEAPRIDQRFDAGGRLHDVHDVKVASTGSSLFAYVANGAEGLAVLQLTAPDTVPGYLGFSPRPAPRLIAEYPTHHPALALSKGLDRDRAVDESGNQVSIFNRIGARPLTLPEMRRLYVREGGVYTVENPPPTPPLQKEGRPLPPQGRETGTGGGQGVRVDFQGDNHE